VIADRFGDLLRMNRFPAGRADGQIVEGLARSGVVLARLREVGLVAFLLQQQKQGGEGRFYVADHAEIDRGAASDLLGTQIDLHDAHTPSLRIELAVRKIGPEHQQDVAVEHRVVARREADQPGHADVVRVVPFDIFFAAHGMHHGRLEALAERQKLVMGTGTP
jgi:hypothetical protein